MKNLIITLTAAVTALIIISCEDPTTPATPVRAESPAVSSIVVTAAEDLTEISRSAGTLQFNKTVTASNGITEDVIWSVSGKDKDGGILTSVDSTIDANGLLTIAANEAAVDLVVRATSKQTGFENFYGEATVFVRKYGDIYAMGDDFTDGWTNATSGSQMTYGSRGVYTLADVLLTKAHTFKFRDGTVTGWNNGNWFHAGTVNTADTETIEERWVGVRGSSSSSGSDNNWVTTHGGKYTITLYTAGADATDMKVVFTSTKQVIEITGGPSALAPGENEAFTYTATVNDSGASVAWAVYGDGVDSHSPQSGTQVSNGTLTLDNNEWIGHTLFVTATSLGETVQSSDYPLLAVPVLDAAVYIVGFMNTSPWDNAGTLMTRGSTGETKHLFTWTGHLSNNKDFRMHRGGGSDWSRPWFTPTGKNDTDNTTYGINESHHTNMPVDRWANAGNSERKWQITGWGDGSYTITYNAAAKTLDVTKN
jgi:hypothetical protein